MIRKVLVEFINKPLFVLAVLGCISACSEQSTEVPSRSESDLIVTDFSGRTITLSQPAKKIVGLAPHVVENVFSAGAADRLVGVVSHSDFPAAAKDIPLVGGYEKINYEKLIELEPDLIVAWQSGNANSSISRLIEMGYQVYIDQPDSLADVAKSIRDIGIMTNNQDTADRVANEYLDQLDAVKEKYKSASVVTSFYQVWNKPLQTISGRHIISDAIEICGGQNIYADETVVAPIINIESILQRDPEAIIASGMSDARPEWLDDWLQWPSLRAVRKNNLFFVNPDHIQRHTIRLLLGVEALCQQLDQARSRRNPR